MFPIYVANIKYILLNVKRNINPYLTPGLMVEIQNVLRQAYTRCF